MAVPPNRTHLELKTEWDARLFKCQSEYLTLRNIITTTDDRHTAIALLVHLNDNFDRLTAAAIDLLHAFHEHINRTFPAAQDPIPPRSSHVDRFLNPRPD